MTITRSPADIAVFRDDPETFFDRSITAMHSIDRVELEALQLAAMQSRFGEHYEQIPIVRSLADRVGVTEIAAFNDVVPLFFAHTAFKSYPAALLDNKRYDLMTGWLDRQTSYDLSAVDVAGASTIDEWIDLLDEQTPLEVVTSSGTTGTISILPKSKHGGSLNMRLWRLFLFQKFGSEPTDAQLSEAVDVIWPNFAKGKLGHLRMAAMLEREFTGGDPSRFHALYQGEVSTDLLFLASKLRAAASRGELDRVEIDPALAARKAEFEALQASQAEDMAAFFSHLCVELRGARVFMISAYPIMYQVAQQGLDKGISGVFDPASAVLVGGGSKGFVLPDNFMDVIREFLGVQDLQEGYGMSEVNALHWACELGRYHIQPWTIPFVLDPDTSEPLPREGVQTGRAAFYDTLGESHWGGIISGDEITIDWSTPCPCGRTSVHIAHDIMRYSEKQDVEDDRITCSATEQVQNEAINFIKAMEG